MTQSPPPISQLTSEQVAQIGAARAAVIKVRRAGNVALVGGWLTGIFAVITLLGSVFDLSVIGLLLGAGMVIISYFEFRGAREIKRLDSTAPRRLAINQLVFGVLLFCYAGIALWQSLNGPSLVKQAVEADAEMMGTLGSIDDVVRTVTMIVYGSVMLAAIIGPGLTAIYYYTRTHYVRSYVEQTPAWILDLQRAGMSI